MAVFKSPLIAAMSGSMAGMTATRGQVGKVLRRRAIPTNPGTRTQIARRVQLGNISIAWSRLTTAQQGNWERLAQSQSATNALGDPIRRTGREQFIAYHTLLRLQFAAAGILTSPGASAFGELPLARATFASSLSGSITLNIPDTPGIGTINDSQIRLLLFRSQPVSPAASVSQATFRFYAAYVGTAVGAPFRDFLGGVVPDRINIVGTRRFLKLTGIRLFTGAAGSIMPTQYLEFTHT
jgi:hypothetical protein